MKQPFCHAPWTNIDINQQGAISPCCKFRHSKYPDPALYIQTATVDEYVNSATLQSVREDFAQGKWPAGCVRCRVEEENRLPSKRTMDYARWSTSLDAHNLTSDRFITGSVAFGNTCNLKCIMCSSWSSSRWHREYRELTGQDIAPVHFYKKGFIEELVEWAPDMLHIDIPGGEPFLSGVDQQHQLLDHYIQTGRSREMTLHYTTNATVWPGDAWWDRWQHFKGVEIQLSIDGVGARFEYIRYPAAWDTVTGHVQQYLERAHDHITLTVAHTVSAYNVYYLEEFYDWCATTGLPKPWCGRVHEPESMRPTVWPDTVNQTIYQRLRTSRHIDVRKWAEFVQENRDQDQFPEFRRRVKWHDEYRGTSFAKTFPEIAQFLIDK